MRAMNSPTLASLAPGVSVAGRMVSATSSRKAMSSLEKLVPAPPMFLSGELVQPDKNISAPTIVPPSNKPTRVSASLLFIVVIFWVMIPGAGARVLKLDISFFQFFYCEICRPRRQRHIGQRRVLTGGGCHTGAVGHENVLRIPNLVMSIQDRGLRVPSHPRRSHFMYPIPYRVPAVPGSNLLYTRCFQHFRRFRRHVLPHFLLIVLQLCIHGQHLQSPFIFFSPIQRNFVLMIGKQLAETGHAHTPLARLAKRFLQPCTNAHLGHVPTPTVPACAALVTKTTQIIALVAEKIGKPHNVYPIGSSAVIILVLISFHDTGRADIVLMIHHVVSELPAAAAESAGPDIRCGVHQDPGAVERACVDKDNLRVKFIGFVRLRIQHFDTHSLFFVLVIENPCHDAIRPHGQIPGSHRRGQRRRLRAEIAAEWATLPAAVPELTSGPARDRRRQIGHASDYHTTLPLVMLFYPCRYIFLHTVQFHRREELSVGQMRQPFLAAADPDEPLHMIVPGFDIFIPDGPVYGPAFARVGIEIVVAPTVALSSPYDCFAANLIGAP